MYPYEFDLLITYTLEGPPIPVNTGSIWTTARSTCVGRASGFNCPVVPGEPFENYQIEFGEPQTADCPMCRTTA
ncbi:MAG: hypothetical protein ACLSAP_06160 [Oscillospiraceae bacterium]